MRELSDQLFSEVLGDCKLSGVGAAYRNTLISRLIKDAVGLGDLAETQKLLENFLSLHPSAVDTLPSLYQYIKNDVGSSNFGRLLSKIYGKASLQIMKRTQELFNVPPLVVSGWMLQRIGEAADQSAGVGRLRQLGIINSKPILCLSKNSPIANNAFIPYLEDVFEILREDDEINAFMAQRVIPRFDSYLMYFDETIFGHASEYEQFLTKKLRDNQISGHAFTLKDDTKEIALRFLNQFELTDGQPFVTLHTREPGYADATHHELRNTPSQNFQKSVDYLIANGIKVVRIGHNKMQPMQERPGFIDLTTIERPGEVDVYLCAENLFYLGTSSGPYSLSYQFGRPSALIDTIGFGAVRGNGLNHMKKLHHGKSGVPVKARELLAHDLDTVFAPAHYEKRSIVATHACEETILSVVKQTLNHLSSNTVQNTSEILEVATGIIGEDVRFSEETLTWFS